jgi:WD40 repeat protein
MAVSNLALALGALCASTESIPWTRCVSGTGPAAIDAATAPLERQLERTRFEIRPDGAELVEQRQLSTLPPPSAPAFAAVTQLPAGQLWSRSDIWWVGKVVSLGNHGTQVFTEFDSGIDHAEFLSGFDESPAAPVWQTLSLQDLAEARVASADGGDSHVTLHQVVTANDQQHRQAIVTKYNSSTSVPAWTYTYPMLIGGVSRLGMSRDGNVIATAVLNQFTSRAELRFFGPNSNVPTGTLSLPSFTQLRAFELSADGSTLYVSSASQGQVIDVATLTTRGAFALPTALDCHAISGDGSVVAYGTFGTLVVWERQAAGNYAYTHTHVEPGTNVCGRIDISDDNSTIAFGFNFYDTNLHVRIAALDVPTKTITMSEDAYGTGTLQNVLADISLSADGSRFAVGLWGDEGDLCPEVRVYNKHSSVPLKLYNLPGSVFDVDLSPDGQRLAVASKQVHANTFASGGTISLYALTREDIRVSGVPRSGSQITVTMRGKPFVQSSLLWTNAPALNPTYFGAMGTLYIQRTTLNSIQTGLTGEGGEVEYVYNVSSNPADIGRSVYFQGFFVTPRRFTSNWVKVTILP